MEQRPRFGGIAIFAVAMSVLILEVTMTRIISIMTYHHFTYLIIGLALLGFGAAGTVLTVNQRFGGRYLNPSVLAECTWLFGLTTALCFLCITRISFDPMAIHLQKDFAQLIGLLLLLILVAIPFFFGGLCIGYLISKSGSQINRLYFCDLVGAGCGSLGALLAINYLGATNTIFWISLLNCLIAMLIAGRRDGRIRWRYPLTAMLVLALAITTLLKDASIGVPFPPSKLSSSDAGKDYRWHVIARVDATGPSTGYPNFSGSLSRTWDESKGPLTYMSIHQDGAAFTGVIDLQDRSPADQRILGYYMQGCPYVIRPGAETLVIGAGGGVDVAIALHHGGRHVTAVEINPMTIDYVQNKFNLFAGGIYRRDDVTVVCAEGRHYLTATDRKFDIIQLSGVDTFTALSSGAYALSENYLYTQEAMSDYYDHLTPHGILSFSRWLFTPPRETLRLVVTARLALEDRGITQADQHIVVLAAPAWEGRSPWAETLIKLKPFSTEEIAALRAWAEEMYFDIIYDPLLLYEPNGPYHSLVPTPKYGPHIGAQALDAVLRSNRSRLEAYIKDYFYKITPATDDSPFFFNYYRFQSLLSPLTASLGGYPVTRLPLGLIILIASLIQVLILGALFILLPMRSQAVDLRGQKGIFSVFLYFACIGAGFMLVEIMLLQKLMVFLGGPVYSMSITLFSLLVFCGIGSYLAKYITHKHLKVGGVLILIAIAVVLYVTLWFVNDVTPALLGLPHVLRCAVAVAGLLPLGLLMGIPFPTGIKIAERLHGPFVPWAWCVNACASVFGSVACILAAMTVGFNAVLMAGIVIYLLALFALLTAGKSSAIVPRPL